MASQKPSPIGASPRSLTVPQDTKSNPSNGLVERVARIVDRELFASLDNQAGFPPESLERWQDKRTADALSKAREIDALYQQEGVLSSQRGDWVLVPREPTGAMLFAAREAAAAEASEAFYTPGYICEPDAAIVYRAMLRASPIAPASQRGENGSANASLRPGPLGPDTGAVGSAAFKTGHGCEMRRLCGDAGYCVGHCTALASARETGDAVRAPREPSPSMIEAGLQHNHRHNSVANMVASYKAMIEDAELRDMEDRQ